MTEFRTLLTWRRGPADLKTDLANILKGLRSDSKEMTKGLEMVRSRQISKLGAAAPGNDANDAPNSGQRARALQSLNA